MTTRLIAALGLLLCLAATAPAQLLQFRGNLDGSQETNPVNTPGTGFGTATFDPATNLLNVSLTFSGLTGTTTDSHIHCCWTNPPSRNAGVALGFSATFPLGVTNGTFSGSYDLLDPSVYTTTFLNASGGTAALARDRLLAAMGNTDPTLPRAYFNIHSSFSGPGEIRGDISPVPEPSTWALASIGGLALAWKARRKLRRSAC